MSLVYATTMNSFRELKGRKEDEEREGRKFEGTREVGNQSGEDRMQQGNVRVRGEKVEIGEFLNDASRMFDMDLVYRILRCSGSAGTTCRLLGGCLSSEAAHFADLSVRVDLCQCAP